MFKKKPYKSVEVGEWLFEWFYDEKNIRGCYLTISTQSAMFKPHIGGSSPVYGYLLAAAEKGKVLCSECGRVNFYKGKDGKTISIVEPGKWHGRFPKEQATEEYKRRVRADGLIFINNNTPTPHAHTRILNNIYI